MGNSREHRIKVKSKQYVIFMNMAIASLPHPPVVLTPDFDEKQHLGF